MTSLSLAQSYLRKAVDRIDILDLLLGKAAYSDVVRESQEIVELCLKGMLRCVGIEPPKVHDVGALLIEHRGKFRLFSQEEIEKLAAISKRLRKERELAFYGDVDFIPTEQYSLEDARASIGDARFVLEHAKKLIR